MAFDSGMCEGLQLEGEDGTVKYQRMKSQARTKPGHIN